MNKEIQALVTEVTAEIHEILERTALHNKLLEQGVQLEFTLTAKLVEPTSRVVQVTDREPLLKEVMTKQALVESGATSGVAVRIMNFLRDDFVSSRKEGHQAIADIDWNTGTFAQFQTLYQRMQDPQELEGINFSGGSAAALLKFMIHFGYYDVEK